MYAKSSDNKCTQSAQLINVRKGLSNSIYLVVFGDGDHFLKVGLLNTLADVLLLRTNVHHQHLIIIN